MFSLTFLNTLSFQNVTKKTRHHKLLLEQKGYPAASIAGRHPYLVIRLLCLEPEFSRMRPMPLRP
jgi:hypothetical protein